MTRQTHWRSPALIISIMLLNVLLLINVHNYQRDLALATSQLMACESSSLGEHSSDSTIVWIDDSAKYSSYLSRSFQILLGFSVSPKSSTKLVLPVANSSADSIVDTFGEIRPMGGRHLGVDIFAPLFSSVCNAAGGILIFRGRDILGGNVVWVLGEDNRLYYYAHLAKSVDFSEGQQLPRGAIIGTVGRSGNAVTTPAHLHFEIMTIIWPCPLVTKNINPFEELRNLSHRAEI